MGKEKPATKTCKHCKTEIPFDAKVCPQCRKKQRPGGCLIAVIAIIIIIIIAAVAGGNNGPKKVGDVSDQSGQSSKNADSEKTEFTVGEIVDLNGIQVTLLSVTESTGSEYNTPTEGNVFLLCEFNIENNSDKEITVSSIMSFDAYCDDYSMSTSFSALLANEDKNQLDGTIASGKKMSGVIGYEVSADWKEIEIKFTPDFWSGKDITFIATK